MADRNSPTGPRAVTSLEREDKILAYRANGMKQEQIAKSLGISRALVSKLLIRACARRREELKDRGAVVLEESLEALDQTIRIATTIALDGTSGKEIRLKALDRIDRAIGRKSVLLGIEAPKKVQVQSEVSRTEIELVAQYATPEESEQILAGNAQTFQEVLRRAKGMT